MKTAAWDRIISSTPLNTDAAKARDGGGFSWSPEVSFAPGKVHTHAPPKMRPVPLNRTCPNLTGLKVGKLTVVGLAAKTTSDGAAWVVRCVCGYYETRKARTLRRPDYATEAMCDECRYMRELRAGRVERPTVAERIARQKAEADSHDSRETVRPASSTGGR